MLKTSLIYGAIAGAIAIGSAIWGQMLLGGEESMQFLEWLGYLVMIVALSMIFVAVKRYRDRELGGVIKFGTAVLLGIAVSAVAGVIYVAAWEVHLAATDYAFIDKYTGSVVADARAEGLAGDALQALVDEMEQMKVAYANPLMRLPMTFLEIFPVGVLISLISAAILRNSRVLPATSSP